MDIHGLFFNKFLKSSFGFDFCAGSGLILSRVVKKVITKNITLKKAKMLIVYVHPIVLSPPPNFETNGKVKPCTIKAAIIAKMNR